MANAAFTLNGESTPLIASHGDSITLALAESKGVKTVIWELFGYWTNEAITVPTITKTGSPSGVTATLTLPSVSDGYGAAYGIRCEVTDNNNEKSTSTAGIYVANEQGKFPAFTGETTEWDSDHGWSRLNEILNAQAGADELNQTITGFPNRVDSVFTANPAGRTFDISPVSTSFYYYIGGVKFTVDTTVSVQWPDVEGVHNFYFDSSGNLQTTQLESDVIDVISGNGAYIAALYWDATNQLVYLLSEERHGYMDGATHIHLHQSFGTQWYSGGELTDITPDASGDLPEHAQLGVAQVKYADEDIMFDISDGNPQALAFPAEIPIYYLVGTGQWRKKEADTFPLIYSGTAGYTGASGRPPFNEFSGGTWGLTEVANNAAFLVHYFATGDVSEPIIGIQGQASYGNTTDARTGAETEIANLQFSQIGGLSNEFAALGTVIYVSDNGKLNTPKAEIRSTADGGTYVDFRDSPAKGGAGGVAPVSSVFGRVGAIAAALGDYDASQIDYNNATSGLTATQAQAAIDEIVGDVPSLISDDSLPPAKIVSQDYAIVGTASTGNTDYIYGGYNPDGVLLRSGTDPLGFKPMPPDEVLGRDGSSNLGPTKVTKTMLADGVLRPPVVYSDASTAHQPTAADEGTHRRFTGGAPITVTLPDDLTDPLPVGFAESYTQGGSGQITFAVGGVGTVYSDGGPIGFGGLDKSDGLGKVVTAIKIAADEWQIYGGLTS